MHTVIIDSIPFTPDQGLLRSELHIPPGGSLDQDLRTLCREARLIASPKALYRVAYIDRRDDHSVVIGGVRLSSRILSVNISDLHRVFPYIATCGCELENWAAAIEGLMQRYMADLIMEAALSAAIEATEEHIGGQYKPGKLSEMNPGSLPDWPIEEQRPLFRLLGDAPASIGVHLKDTLLMTPTKTVSGVKFASVRDFASCLLCPRENCRGRQAPHDPDLYAREYAQ
jgi:hypothetical protein